VPTFVDTCFGTHHAQFGYDADDTLWFSGTGQVAGWVNTKTFDETGDAAKSQGWSPFVLDTNANGKRDEYSEPGKPTDPNKDMRIIPGSGPYAVTPNPADGSIWYTVGVFAGTPGFLRFDPKSGHEHGGDRAEIVRSSVAAVSASAALRIQNARCPHPDERRDPNRGSNRHRKN
jgi:hypothetical protein